MFLSLTAFTGCGSTSDAVDDDKAVEGVDISRTKTTLSKGSTYQLHMVMSYADGTNKDVSSDSSTVWNTSDAEVATVSKDGMVSDQGRPGRHLGQLQSQKANEHFAVTP